MLKSAAQLLHDAREEKGLTVRMLSQRTNIREDYLELMEGGEFSKLPSGPYIRGFLRTCAIELGIDPEHVIAVYRRDYKKEEKRSLIPKGLLKPVRRKHLKIPRIVISVGVLLCVAVAFGIFQWRIAQKPPTLSLIEPGDQQQLASPVLVKGKTSTDAVVRVNTQPVAIDQNGDFRVELPLSEGNHSIVVESQGRNGRKTTVQRSVNVVH